jgi:hypothetical protein
MAIFVYRYELRRGEELIATGRLSRERPLEVGERIAIGGRPGVVRSIEPVRAERELHLVIQLFRDELASENEEGVAKERAWARGVFPKTALGLQLAG